MSDSPSFRQLVAVAATAVVVVTLFILVFVFDAAGCFLYDLNLVLALFLVPAVLFSLGVVVLMFYPMLWLLSLVIKAPTAARPLALSLAVGVHFSIGAIGWAVFDLPGISSDGARAAWIPLWIIGALYKLDVIRKCM